MKERICPRCGKKYTEYPAISRVDNKTEICPDCGVVEAMEDYLFGRVSQKWRKEEESCGQ